MYGALIGFTLMHHQDGISAAIVGKLNYRGRQAEFGVATDTALLLTTHTNRGCGCKARKNMCPILYFVL
jgi:hypothetical protein